VEPPPFAVIEQYFFSIGTATNEKERGEGGRVGPTDEHRRRLRAASLAAACHAAQEMRRELQGAVGFKKPNAAEMLPTTLTFCQVKQIG